MVTNAIEKLKQQEQIINTKGSIRQFRIEITDNKDNTGLLKIYDFSTKNQVSTTSLKIESVSQYQINVIKDNEIIEVGLDISNIAKWLTNFLHYDQIEFVYQFHRWKIWRKNIYKR